MYFHMPIALPQENLYGLMSRFAKLNGFSNHVHACRCFMGNQDISVADAAVKITTQSLLYRYYADLQFALTFQQLRRHLGEPVNVESNPQLLRRNSTLQNESFGDMAYWRNCADCHREDKQQYGVAYWHLDHQLPTTLL